MMMCGSAAGVGRQIDVHAASIGPLSVSPSAKKEASWPLRSSSMPIDLISIDRSVIVREKREATDEF
jgi:hypothetical protein